MTTKLNDLRWHIAVAKAALCERNLHPSQRFLEQERLDNLVADFNAMKQAWQEGSND